MTATSQTPAWSTGGNTPLAPRSPWDKITLGTTIAPGLARVHGSGVSHELQIKKAAGMHGATVTDTGRNLAKFIVTLILGADAQNEWDAFSQLVPLLQPLDKNTNTLEAIAVAHPAINVLGVNACKVERIGVPHPGSILGTYEVDLELLEFKPAVAMPGSGTAKYDVTSLEQNRNSLESYFPNYPQSIQNTEP